MFILSGHLKPNDSKKSRTFSRGPWYTIWPSHRTIMSSNRLNVSGDGCNREMTMVRSIRCTISLKHLTISKVVELSSPVDMSSMKKALASPTSISPASHACKTDKLCTNQTYQPVLHVNEFMAHKTMCVCVCVFLKKKN